MSKESKVGKGRVGIYMPDHPAANSSGYVLRYRLKMEKKLGRLLLPNELVHHKNNNKCDDRLCNLVVIDRATHSSQHGPERRVHDYEEIRRLKESGLGCRRIARHTGYSLTSVKYAFKVLGI